MVFRCLSWRGRLLVPLYRLLLSVTVFNVVFGPRCVRGGMLCESDSSLSPFGTVEALGPCMWTPVPSCAILSTRTLFVIVSAVRDRDDTPSSVRFESNHSIYAYCDPRDQYASNLIRCHKLYAICSMCLCSSLAQACISLASTLCAQCA